MGAIAPTSTDVNMWWYALLGGIPTPGSIPRNGIKGLERETGWDRQKGKGLKGARLVLKDQPPAEGEMLLQLIGPGGFYYWGAPSTDFAQWDNLVAQVLSIAPEKQKAEGIAIYHPQLASVGITSVVVASYSGPVHIGKGLYECRIKLIEWSSPPATNIVSAVTKQAPDADAAAGHKAGGQDPETKSLEAQIAAARQAATP